MKNILVVEDATFMAKAIQHLLTREGFNVLTTDKGSTVVKTIKEKNINLILLDLNLPGMSGEEIFRKVKEDPATKKTKVIILTAKADAIKWDDELKNCDQFMAKPFDNDELINQVKQLLD